MKIIMLDAPLLRGEKFVNNYVEIRHSSGAKSGDSFSVFKRVGKGSSKPAGQFFYKHAQHQQRAWSKALNRFDTLVKELKHDGTDEELKVFRPANMEQLINPAVDSPQNDAPKLGEGASHLVNIFSHSGRFRAAIKNLVNAKGIEYARGVHAEFNEIIEEQEEEIAKQEIEAAKRRKKIQHFMDMLAAEGLSPADLEGVKVKKDNARERLYQCIVGGQVINYNGVGPVPGPMRQYMNANNKSLQQLAM